MVDSFMHPVQDLRISMREKRKMNRLTGVRFDSNAINFINNLQ